MVMGLEKKYLNVTFKPFSNGMIIVNLFLPFQQNDHCSDQKIDQCQGNQNLPPKLHDLIVPESRIGPPLPDEEEEEDKKFPAEPDDAWDETELRNNRLPSSQKECHGKSAHGDHMGIFGHEEEGKFHAAVFDVEPTGQFCLCLGHIKGRPVDFSETANQIKDKGD